jgi:hypothetical protein
VAGCRRIYKKRKTDIRQGTNVFNLGVKIKEYQQNYFKHILRMKPVLFLERCLITILKEEETEEMERSIRLTRRSEQIKSPEPRS